MYTAASNRSTNQSINQPIDQFIVNKSIIYCQNIAKYRQQNKNVKSPSYHNMFYWRTERLKQSTLAYMNRVAHEKLEHKYFT